MIKKSSATLSATLPRLGALLGLCFHYAAWAGPTLEEGFARPPISARPWVYWFWLNGNITSNGITADLEAMQRAGIGGVLIMEVDQGTPKGAAAFGGTEWRKLFQHVCAEAHRLGLQVNMNNDAGWCGSGGPWITPELAMQKIVWTETNLSGPAHFEATLVQPQAVANFYRDIAVLAFPTPTAEGRIEDIQGKAAFVPKRISPRSTWPVLPPQATISRQRVVNLTDRLGPSGHLDWNVPPGHWTILRLGHTTTGTDNHPAPEAGRGLECDKLSPKGADAMFAGLIDKLITDSRPLAGNTLISTHIDSWEVGSQNWTPRFAEEFQRRRGYDLRNFLPVFTGRVVDSLEVSERFLWDVRQTVSDLLVENYAGRLRQRAHQHGLRLSIEAYDGNPCDDLSYAGRADEPMAEFWSWGVNTAYSCTEMSSAAHVYGKPILGAEAFTATDGEKWQLHPAAIKTLGDWAFCEGINRFVFHRYALQPWQDRPPGMSMGPWGLHYERTETWWEDSAAWHEYLARCQFLLQQGLFVADLCYLEPEGSPQRFTLTLPGREGNTPQRPEYNFDGCPPEVVLTRMSVKDGRLVLPDGMTYRMLVLPEVQTMTPPLLRRIKELVRAGATVVGPPPAKSPSLSDYPKCDVEVKSLAAELWGGGQDGNVANRGRRAECRFGKGRIVWDGTTAAADQSSAHPLEKAKWIWYSEGNPAVAAPVAKRYFRRIVELEQNRKLASARIVLTADNAFELWVNGQAGGTGDSWEHAYTFDITRLLKPGANLLAVAASNGGQGPNPAGLIAALSVQFADGQRLEVDTDRRWESALAAPGNWNSDAGSGDTWKPALELGALGMAPWNIPGASAAEYSFPSFDLIADELARAGVPPDFEGDARLHYIHKRLGETEIYFVANPLTNWIGVSCAFRVTGKPPEIWDPMTGRISTQSVYEEREGRTLLPLWLEPAGSLFVVFRQTHSKKAAPILAMERDGQSILPKPGEPQAGPPVAEVMSGVGGSGLLAWQPGAYVLQRGSQSSRFEVAPLPEPLELTGSWDVSFQPNRGAPAKVAFSSLHDWSQDTDPGVKYFSGTARYTKTFTLPAEWVASDKRLYLDLGKVAIMARVKINGRDLGVWWKAPFRGDITDFVRGGQNELEVSVVNLWINRMIGDEELPEDSSRNADGTLKEWPAWLEGGGPSPTGRYTFTTWRLWKRGSPLQESGLLGPVGVSMARWEPLGR